MIPDWLKDAADHAKMCGKQHRILTPKRWWEAQYAVRFAGGETWIHRPYHGFRYDGIWFWKLIGE